MQAFGVLTALDDAVKSGGRHQEHNAGRNQRETRQVDKLRRFGQFFKCVHQDRGELKPEQRLRTG